MSDEIERLNNEIAKIQNDYNIPAHKAFIVWYLLYERFNSREEAYECICDGSNDRGIDAIYLNKDHRKIVLVQSKYHTKGERFVSKLYWSGLKIHVFFRSMVLI